MKRINKYSSGNDLLDYLEEGGKLPGFMGHQNEAEAIRSLRSLGYKNKYERELEEIRNRQFWEE